MTALISLAVTVGVYLLAKKLYQRCGWILLSPLLVTPIVLIVLLSSFQINYETYDSGGKWLQLMLQPATVALAVPMVKYGRALKKYTPLLILGAAGGTVIAVVSSVAGAYLLGLDTQIMHSLAPRSITTPLAINVSLATGGNPSMTAVFVILTGLSGAILAPLLFKLTPLRHAVTKGMMLGIAAHGTGTSKAHEIGRLEGAVASISMIFMGIITTLAAPQLVPLCFQLLGLK